MSATSVTQRHPGVCQLSGARQRGGGEVGSVLRWRGKEGEGVKTRAPAIETRAGKSKERTHLRDGAGKKRKVAKEEDALVFIVCQLSESLGRQPCGSGFQQLLGDRKLVSLMAENQRGWRESINITCRRVEHQSHKLSMSKIEESLLKAKLVVAGCSLVSASRWGSHL